MPHGEGNAAPGPRALGGEAFAPPAANAVSSNLACAAAMMLWATGFPAAEVLLQSWGAIALQLVRMVLGVALLSAFWLLADGWERVRRSPWRRGLFVGGLGFGFGAQLLLFGQQLSDPVTPALAAAMMPIAGAALEVVLDGRRLRRRLIAGIALALAGGVLAAGVRLTDGTFGLGALLCLSAVLLFAWATRATTRDFSALSTIGQTTITLIGGMGFTVLIFAAAWAGGLGSAGVGAWDAHHLALLLVFSLLAFAVAQLLWIRGAGGLGILLASFHMNAVPFYVMVIVVLLLDAPWQWMQAVGAALVAAGVMVAQAPGRDGGASPAR